MAGLIGVLPRPLGYSAFWLTFIAMERPSGTPIMAASGSRVDLLRNNVVDEAIRSKADWILFCDDDHLVPKHGLVQLLEHNVAMVTGLYVTRGAEPRTTQMRVHGNAYLPLPIAELTEPLIEVDATGMGFCLIRREVLEAVKPPRFRVSMDMEGNVTGEDVHFCKKVRKAGFKILVDTQLDIPHIQPRGLTVRDGMLQSILM